MADLLDRIVAEMRDRLEASRAAVAEYERLEAALRALDGTEESAAPQSLRRRRRRGTATSSRTAQRVTTRRRAPRGANREAVLRVVQERPGVTTADLSAASGVERNTLYALLSTLTKRGELEKVDAPGGKTGYALTSGS